MDLQEKVVLVTGAGGGIGKALCEELLSRGVAKIYGTFLSGRDQPKSSEKLIWCPLDVTNLEQVNELAERCTDVDIVINNAGVEFARSFTAQDALKAADIEMKVNFHGTHYMSHCFLPQLKQRQAAMLVNILSIGSFVLVNKLGTYCASKAAAHFLTKGLRVDCKETNVRVMAVYPGYVDTAMTQPLDVEKVTPLSIAQAVCNAMEEDREVVFPDPMAISLKEQVPWDNAIFEALSH